MKIQDHYENLASLYLRLNGFVTLNLIIHSEEHGYEKSELDFLAVRMPLHQQNDRNVATSEFLELPKDRIQIIIGDSKSSANINNVKFNNGLKDNQESIKKLLEWIGIFEIIDNALIQSIQSHLQIEIKDFNKGFNYLDFDTAFGRYRLIVLFFCPTQSSSNDGEMKYVHGQEMIDYCWKCLNKEHEPDECNRTYSLKHWHELKPYVAYFKETEFAGTIDEFNAKFQN